MLKSYKLTVSASMLLLACILLFLFWQQSIVLTIGLLVIFAAKYQLFPIKYDFLWFIGLSVGGAIVEILMVNVAHSWGYVVQNLFNIPIWMPIFWGVVGSILVVVHDALPNNHHAQ